MLKISEFLNATCGKLAGRLDDDQVISGFSIDSRTIKKGQAFIAIKGDNFDGHNFVDQAIKKGSGCVVVQLSAFSFRRPVEVPIIFVKDTLKALADAASFLREKISLPIVAVSGSNGKTTTKEIISWVLSARFKVLKNEGTQNNRIGLPMTLLRLDPGFDIGVVELGTNHFKEIGSLADICLPNIGIITNIGPAHLEYFGSLEGVFREKYSLIAGLKRPYIGILNNDDTFLRKAAAAKGSQSSIFTCGIKNKSDFTARQIQCVRGKTGFSLKKQKFVLNTWGEYNIYNALAAIAVARIFGMSYRQIARRLNDFQFPQNRLQVIEIGRSFFINDTYNANPASFRAALYALAKMNSKGKKIVVMGDMLELGQDQAALHAQAGREAAKFCDIFIAVGSLSRFAAQAAIRSGAAKVFSCNSAQEAKQILAKLRSPGGNDLVLVKGSRAMRMEKVL